MNRLLPFILILSSIPSKTQAMYVLQPLVKHVESADIVAQVQIVSGQVHQFSQVYTDYQNPEIKHFNQEICGFSYTARVVESFKGDSAEQSYVKFTAIESFNMNSYQLIFLSTNKSALSTDVMNMSASETYNNNMRACKKGLPKLYSQHLSTGEFTEANMWVGVNGFADLPEDIFISPEILIKPSSDIDGVWNSVPSILKMYGNYARWHEFRTYLLDVIEENESN